MRANGYLVRPHPYLQWRARWGDRRVRSNQADVRIMIMSEERVWGVLSGREGGGDFFERFSMVWVDWKNGMWVN